MSIQRDESAGQARGTEPAGQRNGGSRAVGHPALAGFDARQIAAAREAVLDRVRRSFRRSLSEEDVEDAAQEAWAALLEQQGDTPVRDLAAFVAEVGWRSARGVTRRPRAVTLDPEDTALLEREDLGSSPLERVDRRAALARIVEAVEQFTETEREAFRLWFVDELEAVDAAKELGISRSAYFKRLTAAKARLEGAMSLEDHRFARAQRRLISDYVAGIAEGRARLRAEKLIAGDPQAAAMAREIRRTHEAGAAVLPVLFLGHSGSGEVVARAAGVTERLRDAVTGWLGRGPDAADVAASPVLSSGGARGAGAVGAGLVAKAFGGLSAGGLAAGCLGGGAVITVACVATGLVSLPGQGGERGPDAPPAVERAAEVPRLPVREPAVGGGDLQEAVAENHETPKTKSSGGRRDASPQASPPEPEPTLEPNTAPEVQEFGVAGAGVPVGGAPPDTDDSNGASASTVRQQFGP